MAVLAGRKFAKRMSPSGALVDAEAFGPLKIRLRPGRFALRLARGPRLQSGLTVQAPERLWVPGCGTQAPRGGQRPGLCVQVGRGINYAAPVMMVLFVYRLLEKDQWAHYRLREGKEAPKFSICPHRHSRRVVL